LCSLASPRNSKLKFIVENSRLNKPLSIQLIALSATIQNIEDLATWFHAALYVTSYRPVPLREMVCAGLDVFESNGTHLRKLELPKVKLDTESATMLFLCLEGTRLGQQVIIFCSSRNQCETTVRLLCDHLPDPPMQQSDPRTEARKKALEEYKGTYPLGYRPTPSQELLERGIGRGVAYHHAGMTSGVNLFFLFFIRS
jgi:helicase